MMVSEVSSRGKSEGGGSEQGRRRFQSWTFENVLERSRMIEVRFLSRPFKSANNAFLQSAVVPLTA